MRGSWKLARIAGIDVYIHWTFVLLIAWIAGMHALRGESLQTTVQGVGLILAIFACVVAHEFGHALTARRFGIKTQDITLWPIGGVARLERMPDDPVQELWVALAGPAVNVVIAGVLFVAIGVLKGFSAISGSQMTTVGGDFLQQLLGVNVILVVFNLLPAFPMDGGRVLRALLATQMDHVRATDIAATIGQGMAIFFGIVALFVPSLFLLLFIALFVYLGAQQEAQMVHVQSLLRGVPVRAAMITRFRAVAPDEPLSRVVEDLLAGYQHDFPVLDQGRIVGLLTRADLVAALAQQGQEARVGEIMRRDCGAVDDGEMLENAFRRMREGECGTLPVVRDGTLVGMLNLENVGEWMMIQTAFANLHGRTEGDKLFAAR